MIRTIIFGAAGRMGRRLVSGVLRSDDMTLAGAVERSDSPDLGADAAALAGETACGVKVVSDVVPLLVGADVVINFATEGVIECVRAAASAGVAAVIGTTALDAATRAELAQLASKGARIVLASNMSVGVNALFKLVREAARILGPDYDVEIVEMHHNQKKDAPSGTAVSLANIICEERGLDYDRDIRHGRVGMVGARTRGEIGMHSLRGGDVVGDHTVIFSVGGERVELAHKASSRDTFARGALAAARFLFTAKPGLYDMQDVLKLK